MDIGFHGSSSELFPTELHFGVFLDKEGRMIAPIEKEFPFKSGWGKIGAYSIGQDDETPWPNKLDIVWLSIVEQQFYHCSVSIPNFPDKDFDSKDELKLVVGMGPAGILNLWLQNYSKSKSLGLFRGSETSVDFDSFFTPTPGNTLAHLCEYHLKSLGQSPSMPVELFAKRHKLYNFRFIVDYSFLKGGKSESQKIDTTYTYKISFWDGAFDLTDSNNFSKHTPKAKPKKMEVKIVHNKNEMSLHFWIDEKAITEIFERFYGLHPETKTDFIIQVDPDNNRYELALFRQGMKEPKPIPKEAFQLIVFKDQFETYRSENYDQPRGAWIW